MKNKSLSLNAMLNGLRSILNLLFPLITFPYVSRILSVKSMGIYNFANTYVSYFLLIAGLGISTYAIREGAKYRDNKDKISYFSSQIFTINIYSTIFAYLLLILSLLVFKNLNNYVSSILIFSMQLIFTTIGTEWIYIIYEDYSYITVRSIIFKLVSMLLLFILVKKPNDYLWYATITIFASVGSNILNYAHAKKMCKIKLVSNTNFKKHIKPILIIFSASVAVTIYVSSDTTILGLLKGDYAVGVYSVSVKIYQIAQSLLSALLTVTIPRLAMLIGQKRLGEYRKVLTKVIDTLGILVLPAAVGLIMLSKEIVLIIAGSKYIDSIGSLRIITWAIIFSIFSWIFSECVLIPSKRESKVLSNTIITAVINIILNMLLIPIMSYDGTSLSTVISEFIVMILNGVSGWDVIKPILQNRQLIGNLFSSIGGCIGIIITCILCGYVSNNDFVKIILSVSLSILVYGVILVLLKNSVAILLIERVKGKLKQ